jgi:pyruvate dehydrogenase E2 component (dihydrolipoamide acetyltransferase)/4,5:9,10-diseco-3-hydroxy-5,9,17-trioxoandrosta-1(10),2-diene-4-oate hydrolase
VKRKKRTITEPYASSVPQFGLVRRLQRVALALFVTLITLLIGGVLYGAYGYQPPEVGRGYDSPYLQQVGSRFVETPVARFHYVHAGEGSPVILVSPESASVVAWKHQLSALTEHHSVYVLELPGQGYTELKDPNLRWDLTGMTRALGSFMDAVGIQRAAIAGNSWSGGWALAFAQRHPERVSKLMLLDSCGLDVRDPWQWEILKYPVAGELLTNLFTTKSTVRAAAENSIVHRKRVTDKLVNEYWAPMTLHDNRRANYLLERGLDWQLTERAMPTTETPTLVLWGSEDKILAARQAERFGRLMPNARVRVLEGCGHALEYDCPVRVNDQMEAFLDEQ